MFTAGKIPAALIVAMLLSVPAFAQPDAQFRLLLHKQHLPQGHSVGLAGWAVAPDLLAPGPVKGLLVGGLLFKGKDRWVEVMLGQLVAADGTDHDILDIRSSGAVAGGKLDGYAEAFYDLDARRWVLQPKFTVRLPSTQLRLGAEVDVVAASGKKTSATGGPRLALPFKLANGKTSNLALAYHYPLKRADGPFLRAYATFNF